SRDWSSDVCSSDLARLAPAPAGVSLAQTLSWSQLTDFLPLALQRTGVPQAEHSRAHGNARKNLFRLDFRASGAPAKVLADTAGEGLERLTRRRRTRAASRTCCRSSRPADAPRAPCGRRSPRARVRGGSEA